MSSSLHLIWLNRSASCPVTVCFLHAEKAFDGVELKYLLTGLGKFGFGSEFQKLTDVLQNGLNVPVQTN